MSVGWLNARHTAGQRQNRLECRDVGVSGSRHNKLSGTLRAKAAAAITADNYKDYPEQAVR